MFFENVINEGVIPTRLFTFQIILELATPQPDLIFALLSVKPEDINFETLSSGAVSLLSRTP